MPYSQTYETKYDALVTVTDPDGNVLALLQDR
jgi:hypothetical protein